MTPKMTPFWPLFSEIQVLAPFFNVDSIFTTTPGPFFWTRIFGVKIAFLPPRQDLSRPKSSFYGGGPPFLAIFKPKITKNPTFFRFWGSDALAWQGKRGYPILEVFEPSQFWPPFWPPKWPLFDPLFDLFFDKNDVFRRIWWYYDKISYFY